MFENIFRLLSAGGQATHEQARQLHDQLVVLLLAFMAVIGVMWGLNVTGFKFVNAFIFAFGGLFIFVQATRPIALAGVAAAGASVAWMADRDVSKGALQGLSVFYRVVLGALFGFWVLAGLLATWSFEESPRSFFIIMGMILMVTVTTATFKMATGKLSAKIIITYSVVVMLTAFWQTLTPEQKAMVPLVEDTAPKVDSRIKLSKDAKEADVLRLNFSQAEDGDVLPFTMPIGSMLIITKRQHQPGQKPFQICLLDKSPIPDKIRFEPVANSDAVAHMRLSAESQQLLLAVPMNFVNVVVSVHQTYDNPCQRK